ncbi:hypothetical protein NPIL_458981 [Nephila pilipes]|uniref:Uncharacterized protein n=1 Tax=Nephila pilipes TaxID=299642 RepID=A0A8X6NJ83_NEPPI|nr:hypothetical protein NPIL_458981 [Nephila pilipes]
MRKEFRVLLFMMFFCHSEICGSQSPDQKVCTDLLPPDYAIHKPSSKVGKSTKVFTWVQILDFGDINQANMIQARETGEIVKPNGRRFRCRVRIESFGFSGNYKNLSHIQFCPRVVFLSSRITALRGIQYPEFLCSLVHFLTI